MPIMAYCRKCKEEVAPGGNCPLCGGKLPKTSLRVSWGMTYRPLTDWFAWNAVLRVGIPVVLAVGLMILINETVQGGSIGLQIILKTWFFPLLGSLLLLLCGGVVIFLSLRGKELHFFVLDHKAAHVQVYKHAPKNEPEWLLRTEKHLPWSEIRRIQALQEKNAVLLYAPAWWHALTLYGNSESYPDAVAFIRQRTQKARDIRLSRPCEGFDDIT